MPFNPYSGSDGRVKLVVQTPDLTKPIPTIAGITAAIAGLDSWKITVTLESGDVVHFESPAAASGPVWAEQIQGGILRWKAVVTGKIDAGNMATYFTPGSILEVDFIFSRGGSFGRKNNVVKVTDFEEGQTLDGAKPMPFSASFAGHGALTAPS